MIGWLLDWSLKNRLFVLLLGLLLLLWGGYETTRMPVDVFPDLTAPTVTLMSEAHGMAPAEVEQLVTFPIEAAMNGAPGVRRVRSTTGVGFAVINVEFAWGTDIYQARQIVAEKLQLARSALPQDLPSPILTPIASVMGEILFIALRSDHDDGMTLKTTADWTIRRRLLAVPGVAEVISIGGDTKQYQVEVRPERLVAYGLSLNDVIEAVRASNTNASAGFLASGGQEYLIQGLGRVKQIEDLAQTAVSSPSGPVLLKHIADIRIGPAYKRGTGSHDGEPAVIIGIQKQPSVNTLELTERLEKTLNEIQTALPKGMSIDTNIFRQADFIAVAVANLGHALRDGAILVVIIVALFLLSARATLITLIALPISLIVAVLAMSASGATLNTMTLGGLAIALGALVDDAIIVVENIVRRLRERAEQPSPAPIAATVLRASHEILGSIVYATLIIMLVFVPLFFLSGIEGRLMQPLGFAYVVAIAASLLVAVTVTPALSSYLLPHSRTVTEAHESKLALGLKTYYTACLARVLPHWRWTVVASTGTIVATLIALALTGRSFLPEFNEGSLTIAVVTLPGTSLEQSDQIGQMAEKIILQLPETAATARRTGRAELDPHAQAVYASEIDVRLAMKDRDKETVLAELRRKLTLVPGANAVIGQPISHRIDHMLSGTRANIAVKIFGDDLAELRRLAQQVKGLVDAVEGAVDVSIDNPSDVPFLSVKFDRAAIARYGFTMEQVAEVLETAFQGKEVSRIFEGQTAFDLVVRYPSESKEDLDAVRATLLTTANGAQLPLHALADIQKTRGPDTISREDVQRKLVVMANVAGRDLAGVVNDIRQRVTAQVQMPSGYHIEYGGQFESAQEAAQTLLILGAVVTAGIFLLLYVAFHSMRDALLVMSNLPLALVGGVIGVYVSGGILSVASMIGFITLFGIATRNGVMLVAHIRNLWEQEGVKDFTEAVRRGASERLIPILMTALAAGLGLAPLAFSGGEPGSEIQAPMATVILFGLLTSTVLNLLVVPVLYLRFGDLRNTVPGHLTRTEDE
ncbi:efflux RND transporter permease subunit [Methylomonas sp. LL1]|uniref:efflux RND transporter permease subunit n=1 Tax=Methylomonas sp. LL1 TaxID=2785785 RepID=UPI0018C36D73|nr:efflux RND transporter permease subunit [Methylomonas sp. LL1]QPK61649.1 efflux RND transporter permease subunit [Methylomonas sp. LL1]